MNKTDKELRQVALGLKTGTIFCNRHVKEAREVTMIFQALNFLDEKQAEDFKKRDIGLIYEETCNAAPRSVNGFPMFFSLQTLTKKETEKTLRYHEELVKFEEGSEEDGRTE